MRVEVVRDPATKMVDVYVVRDGFSGGPVMQAWTPIDDGTVTSEWTDVPLGGQCPVSLRLPEELWTAMVAAGADVPMPSRAQHDHLADALEVRDKLLPIVLAAADRGIGGTP